MKNNRCLLILKRNLFFVPYYAIIIIKSYVYCNFGVDYLKRHVKEILIVSLFTAFMGQVHFYPFGTDFRITIGVVVFTFLILYFQSLSIVQTSIITGLCVLMVRTSIDVFTLLSSVEDAIARHIPAFMYYITYGIIIEGVNFKKYIEKPVYFVIILSAADIISNFFELIIRNQLRTEFFSDIFSTILLAAFLRSLIVLMLFWVVKYYNLIIAKEEHQKRYKELLLLTAKFRSEIFFLRKSMQEIENAMVRSYSIYNAVKNSSIGESDLEKVAADCLALSIDIHEIKKDYNRIVMSMEKLMPTDNKYSSMKLSEIFETINDVFSGYLDAIEKNIKLTFEMDKDFKTDDYLIVISILNNLIQNSIEASMDNDPYINVKCMMNNENITFSVTDNGKGIKDKDRELIFEPGYTTKFNPETGKVSTGLGLTHIKMLTKHLKGKIRINTETVGVTEFIVEFPTEVLVIKED